MNIRFHYCKAEIEGQKSCSIQCSHCKEYYYPLEEERRQEDLREWIESKKKPLT